MTKNEIAEQDTNGAEVRQVDVAFICALHSPELDQLLRTGPTWAEEARYGNDPQTYHLTTLTTPSGKTIDAVAAAPTAMGLVSACSLVNSQPSSCVDSSNRLRIRSTPNCSGNEPFEICRNNDSRWKTIVAHEVGHVMQRRATGLWFVAYGFGTGAQFTVDHPGAPLLCQCQHITSDADTNNKHCMQSLESPGAAQVEGFAQYFAAKVWNDLDEPECTIPYYKQFLDTTCRVAQEDCSLHPDWVNNGLIVNSPPVPISCIDPQKWRNRNCLSGVFGPDEVPTDLSTEMDWMGFYYKLTNPQTANRLTTGQLFETYRRACGAVTGGACNGSVEAGWRTVPNTTPPVTGVKEGANALFAQGAIDMDQLQRFLQLGDAYSVSESTQP